jgi:hypothetical protein
MDLVAVERWLDQSALFEPIRSIAGQQTVSGDRTQHIVLKGILAVIAVIPLQDMLDGIWMVEQEHFQWPNREIDEVSVPIGALGEQGERVSLKQAQILQQHTPGRPRWSWIGNFSRCDRHFVDSTFELKIEWLSGETIKQNNHGKVK